MIYNLRLGNTRAFSLLMLLLVVGLVACDRRSDTPLLDADPMPALNLADTEARQLAQTLWQQAGTLLTQTRQQVEQLNQQITVLLKTPNTQNLTAAQNQWRVAFHQYQALLPFLYLEHPQAEPLTALSRWRFLLAAWPMQPGYLDSFDVHAHSGIVNDISLPLTREQVQAQHGLTDSEEVTLGFHGIEFLLWGDNGQANSERLSLQTKVPLALAQSGLKVEELPNNRRRELLRLQSEILLSDMNELHQQWQSGLLPVTYSSLSPNQQLQAMHQSMLAALQQLVIVLQQHGRVDQADHLSMNRFAGKRAEAFEALIETLQQVYNDQSVSLATAWLPEKQQETLYQSLTDAKHQLGNGSDVVPLIDVLQTSIALMTVAVAQPE